MAPQRKHLYIADELMFLTVSKFQFALLVVAAGKQNLGKTQRSRLGIGESMDYISPLADHNVQLSLAQDCMR